MFVGALFNSYSFTVLQFWKGKNDAFRPHESYFDEGQTKEYKDEYKRWHGSGVCQATYPIFQVHDNCKKIRGCVGDTPSYILKNDICRVCKIC